MYADRCFDRGPAWSTDSNNRVTLTKTDQFWTTRDHSAWARIRRVYVQALGTIEERYSRP